MGQKMCCSPNGQQPSLGRVPQKVIQHQIQNCTVALTLGQVFQEDVDSIVVVTNTKLKLSETTAMEVKKLGGHSIIEDLSKILLQEGGKLDYGEVVYTHAGDLDYDYIFYAVLPSCSDSVVLHHTISSKTLSIDYEPSNSLVENLKFSSNVKQLYVDQQGNTKQRYEKQHIFECILNTLQLAEELGLTSIAFPVMEPTNLHISKSLIATITLVAIKTYIKESKKNALTNIHISIQDIPTLHLFKWAFQQIIIEGTDVPENHNQTNINQGVNNHYWGIKASLGNSQMNDSIDIGTDDLMRFGHALQDDTKNSSKHKNSI